MSNVLSREKREQVIALGRLGWFLRRIEQATGVHRETAGEYLRGAGIALRRPGGWGRRGPAKAAIDLITDSEGGDSKPAMEVITDFSAKTPGCGPASRCEAYGELIAQELDRGRNSMGIWQDLVDRHGFNGGYQSVLRYVRKLRAAAPPEARAIIETPPGQECQVNYGTGPMVRDPVTSKCRRTRLFVLTLGCSRKSIRLLVFRSSSRAWAELHEKAFRRLGGTTRIVVLDNLRDGVLAPDIYDPQLNPLYRDILAHYGVTALPCRVRAPHRKGKVESGVAHAQNCHNNSVEGRNRTDGLCIRLPSGFRVRPPLESNRLTIRQRPSRCFELGERDLKHAALLRRGFDRQVGAMRVSDPAGNIQS